LFAYASKPNYGEYAQDYGSSRQRERCIDEGDENSVLLHGANVTSPRKRVSDATREEFDPRTGQIAKHQEG